MKFWDVIAILLFGIVYLTGWNLFLSRKNDQTNRLYLLIKRENKKTIQVKKDGLINFLLSLKDSEDQPIWMIFFSLTFILFISLKPMVDFFKE